MGYSSWCNWRLRPMALSGAVGSHSAAGRGHYWRTLDSSVFRRRSHHLSVLGRIISLINLRANLVRVVCFSPVFDGFSCLVWDEHGSMVRMKSRCLQKETVEDLLAGRGTSYTAGSGEALADPWFGRTSGTPKWPFSCWKLLCSQYFWLEILGIQRIAQTDKAMWALPPSGRHWRRQAQSIPQRPWQMPFLEHPGTSWNHWNQTILEPLVRFSIIHL